MSWLTTILHISDTHAQSETMLRLNTLARCPECKNDVVAVTGDCRSSSSAPDAAWNGWPQTWKFCVKGNHDRADTFDELSSWSRRRGPWGETVGDLRFIGVDRDPSSGSGLRELQSELEEVQRSNGIRSVVVLSHRRPPFEDIVGALGQVKGLRAVLALHGHEHGAGTSVREIGTDWQEEFVSGVRVFRSNVYSAADRRRGCAHRIRWDGEGYSCEQVRVDVKATPANE